MSGFDVLNETTVVVSGSYTVGDNDYNVFVEGATANATVTLPNAAALAGATSNQGKKYTGRSYTITKGDTAAFTVTVAAAGGSVLGGTNPMPVSAVHSLSYMSDGTNWICVGAA